MASKTLLLRSLREKSFQAEQTLLHLKKQLEQIKKSAATVACACEEERYRAENEKLKNEVAQLRAELIEAETKNGLKQVPLPSHLKSSITSTAPTAVMLAEPVPLVVPQEKPIQAQKQQGAKSERPPKKHEKSDKKQAEQSLAPKTEKQDGKGSLEVSPTVDVSRLNMKIGKIVAVDKHPDADSLYVEQVDLGEGRNRVIISGLVKHVPIEQMQDRLAVFLTNLKPAKMRGILSEGMIMCANTPEKVEIIEPPPGAEIGDRVTVEGYPGEPDDMLNPKKKTWEMIVPDLQANTDGYATYKGALWKIDGKGHFRAPTVRNGQIK